MRSTTSSLTYPPTLIFTGATASLKGSALCASFATGKFALRALAQSLGREFGPQGIHVAHAIIDGVIDIPRTKDWVFEKPDAKLSAEAVSLTGFSCALLIAWYINTLEAGRDAWMREKFGVEFDHALADSVWGA